ncbi:MAG: Glyceraldehyde-3-phosphate dehydrogenase [Methanomassiliicoccales archaeon PtaU1.Bin124]|nr:MAG: Glyceraldehyde-3-phosphate dehydrogenase [Methanomassiliicoccales archaeon PtaU1.Bin124]
MKIRVGVNGFGTIGKRAAWAVSKQDDMEVVGVTKTRPSFEARNAIKEGFPLFAACAEDVTEFDKAGIKTSGTLDDLISKCDIVIDTTPGGVGADYKPKYEKAGVKAIFQGGEDHSIAGISFNAIANYHESWGASFVRVVSCNTTGLCRTLYPLDKAIGIQRVIASLVRRGADPGDKKGSMLNSIEPALKLPTHHGPDVQTIMPWLKIQTMAVVTPTTLMHVHCIAVDLKREAKEDEVLGVLSKSPRVRLISGKDGVRSTGQIMELARDMGNLRGDMMDICVWKDGIKVTGNQMFYYQAIHQESDVVPENVDCIRAMCKLEQDPLKSIAKTDKAIGLAK